MGCKMTNNNLSKNINYIKDNRVPYSYTNSEMLKEDNHIRAQMLLLYMCL